MKKLKSTILFVLLLISINSLYAQTLLLTEPEQTNLQTFLDTNPALVNESVAEIVCEPIDDIFNLKCPNYQLLVTGNDYTDAINAAILDAKNNGGGVILFPGNTIIEITSSISLAASVNNDIDNITLRASHSKATVKFTGTVNTTSQMLYILDKKNISIENISFDANERTGGITINDTSGLNIIGCEFKNFMGRTFGENYYPSSAISMRNVTDVSVNNCKFKNAEYGINIGKRNTRLKIEDNFFEASLTRNPIYILGNKSTTDRHFSEYVWILNNHITIKRAPSIIDDHAGLSRTAAGVVEGLGAINGDPGDTNYNEQFYTWRWTDKGASAIYITSGNTDGNDDLSSYANYHQNVVVDGNIAIGSDYGFFDGGSADLYSLKDIVRLKCTNNVARNSGDLGFAIERCRNAIVSNNTADRNNSFGIGIASTRNSVISSNICDNNALRRDFMYNSTPYGSILVSGASINNIIEGNSIYSYSTSNVSFPTLDSYTNRASPTDYYGIIFRANYDDTAGASSTSVPLHNKVGLNHYSGLKWGPIYNEALTTQIDESFSATTFPKNQDYPLGTWFRNSNMNNTALGWSVINRVETKLHANWTVGDTYLEIKDPTNSIQVGDIIGVMLDDGNVHWSEIDELMPQIDYYKVKLLQFPTINISEDGILDPAPSTTQTPYNDMYRIIVLRWLTVTK